MFPPAFGGDEVVAAVAVDIAIAKTVGEALPLGVGSGGSVEGPRARRIFGVGRGVAEAAGAHADENIGPGGEEWAEGGRLVVDGQQGDVAAPDGAGGARVFIPRGVDTGET